MHAVLILDGYPVFPGHSLVIPKRHVGSFLEVTELERAALFALLDRTEELVAEQHRPDGYNIGINDGAATGQIVPRVHIHLIPGPYTARELLVGLQHCWRRDGIDQFNPAVQMTD